MVETDRIVAGMRQDAVPELRVGETLLRIGQLIAVDLPLPRDQVRYMGVACP